MQGDREWMRDFLLGFGQKNKNAQLEVARIVGGYLRRMFAQRDSILNSS